MRKETGSVAAALAVVLTAVVFGGCGAGKSQDTVSMYDLNQTMEAADQSLPDMLYASSADDNAEEQFVHISDMDYSKVDSYFVSYSKEGKADEITVIAVKDPADVTEAKESLERHRQSRIKLLNQYEPREVKRMEDGVIYTQGQYAVLLICDHSDAVRRAFEDFVKK